VVEVVEHGVDAVDQLVDLRAVDAQRRREDEDVAAAAEQAVAVYRLLRGARVSRSQTSSTARISPRPPRT
jgi:hypothetical protein